MTNNKNVLFSSEKENWGTPQYIFDYWNRLFAFTLDVCADDKNYKVKKYYTIKDDGLSPVSSWTNHVCWMNPPYGRSIKFWVRRAANEAKYNGSVVVGMLPANTGTKWWHQWVLQEAKYIFFEQGRVKFINPETGLVGGSAPADTAYVIWGDGEKLPTKELLKIGLKHPKSFAIETKQSK